MGVSNRKQTGRGQRRLTVVNTQKCFLVLFISCITFHMNNGKPTLASPTHTHSALALEAFDPSGFKLGLAVYTDLNYEGREK